MQMSTQAGKWKRVLQITFAIWRKSLLCFLNETIMLVWNLLQSVSRAFNNSQIL